MVAGELYRASDPELVRERARARRLLHRYNATGPDDEDERRALLSELLAGLGDRAVVEPPFHCDYGWNLSLGDDAYLNVGCVVLDCAPVEIGPLAKLGPGVELCAATHPTDPAERADGLEYALPIRLGRNVWLGAGSVVLRDVPPLVVAAGNPCRVLRELP